METIQKILYVLLGIVCAVALFCIVVGIGCAINGVTFGQQIVNWFGTSAPVVDETVETVTMLKPII